MEQELNNACLKLKQALNNPFAITRREQQKKDVADAWKRLAMSSSQKNKASSKGRFFYC